MHPDRPIAAAALAEIDVERRQLSPPKARADHFMALSLIERARAYVSKMPAAVSGQNGHGVTFHVACVLVQGFGLTPTQAMPLLEEYNERCEPPWSTKELEHKLDGADKAFARQQNRRGYLANGMKFIPSAEYRQKHGIELPKKPEFVETALSRFAGEWAGKIDLLWLAARSSEDPCVVSRTRFLELLYRSRGGELFSFSGDAQRQEKVLIFTDNKSQGEAVWPDNPVPERGPHGVWFLAQPVSGKYHPNPRQGTMSRRSEEAVTSWRYFVIESDRAKTRQWLGAIVQFPLKIAAIYSSGGRSVHALVRIDAKTKGQWDAEREAMKPALVVLGADPGAMTAVRLTRLPGCWRGRNLQKLLYINPDPPMRPICELAPRRDVLAPWLKWASAGIADSDETNGEALTRALHYYAPVSEDCRNALRRLHHR
jgi:hypothetical protein